jgi:reactive intermediate/imine deaminase
VDRERIQTDGAPRPAGPYSQAIRAGGFLFLAGQGPNTPDGGRPETFEGRAEQALRNLAAVASAAGADLRDAVRVGVFLRDMGDFPVMNEVYQRHFGEPFPARTTIQSDLPGFDIEVDAIVLLRG